MRVPQEDKGTLVVGGTSARGETISLIPPRSPHATRSGCLATSPRNRHKPAKEVVSARRECGELRRRAQRGGPTPSA